MKFEVKQTAFNEVIDRCIPVGYCELHYLLLDLTALAYTHGTYGWNADIYGIDCLGEDCHDFHAYYVVTGYRTFGKMKSTAAINAKYEELAREAVEIGRADRLPELRRKWLGAILYTA